MPTPTGSPTPHPLQLLSTPLQPSSSDGAPLTILPATSTPAAFPTTFRCGLGLSERPVRRFSNPPSGLGHSEVPVYQPSPRSEGGASAAAKRREREFFHTRDVLNMSANLSFTSNSPVLENCSPASLAEYERNGTTTARPYRRVASFNTIHPVDDVLQPDCISRRRRPTHDFDVSRREQMNRALHYDICDELDRSTSSLDLAPAPDARGDLLYTGPPDVPQDEASCAPSPPPSFPRPESPNFEEQNGHGIPHNGAPLEYEISRLRARVEDLSYQLLAVRVMCQNLSNARNFPPMVPYCAAPHLSPNAIFTSTVQCTHCESHMHLDLIPQSVNTPFQLAVMRST
ncbi:unnamed protein product [Peniophora sp. CBMAI 1063]|nr:unnamed protein product [Peniophora sp. CBMAI 1063]